MATSVKNFKISDFVWAKFSSYPPWPSIVMPPHPEAPPKATETSHWIYFFGTHNYSWIEEKNIFHFETFKEKYKNLSKRSNFKQGVKEAEDHIKALAKDPNYKIEYVEYKLKRAGTPKKVQKSRSIASDTPTAKRPAKKSKGSPKKRPRSSLSGEVDVDSDGISTINSPVFRPDSASVYDAFEGDALRSKSSDASNRKFGVLGIGPIGNGVIKNLLSSGHRINIYSESNLEYKDFGKYTEKDGLVICNTPREVVRKSDIIFSCLADPESLKAAFNDFGILNKSDELLVKKGFVEMTGIDPETSKTYCELVEFKEGQYLEAQLQGNKTEATDGNLIVLASGSEELFLECHSCFKAMGKATFYLGKVGAATKANLILQLMRGVFLAGLSEAFAMADKCEIDPDLFFNIIKNTTLCSTYLERRAKVIVEKTFQEAEEPLYSLQRDMAHGMDLSNRFRQPMPMVASANEMFKYTRRLGYDNHDSSCVYQRARH